MTAATTRVSAFTDDALGTDDATGVAERIARGEISASEAVDAAIARVEAVNADLNAVASTDHDRARARAARVAQGRTRGAFAGVPTATKENIHVAGMPAGMGSRAVPKVPGDLDGAFTKQFFDTGVIPVCSTTMPEFGWTATTERVGGDVTRNPWDTAYSSGGSSGGSAALVASGALPFAHGNDGGGSIRIPAAVCGLVGLKATRGRLRLDEGNATMPVRVVVDGVLTRSVRDTARFFEAAERSYRNTRLQPIGHVEDGPARPLRVGMMFDSPVAPPSDADARAAVERTATLLESLGHSVVDYVPPIPTFFKADFEDYWSLLAYAVSSNRGGMFGSGFDAAQLDPLTLGLAKRFRRRAHRTPLFIARLAASGAVQQKRFGDVDLVLSPVLVHNAPRIGYLGADQSFEEHFEKLVRYAAFTPLANATGAPAISLPLGQTDDGRPVGIMLSARRGEERRLLEIAFDLEEASPFASLAG
ncbi:amidase [Knoellia subterranea]|uniref:Amidase n=1 Tax=Knoellia subterranea KCTC 19937 TaxID=1385521 RepID=A0A0A0JKA1_9MICO|nr:amidase [Knoellia subterranea]KGN37204.1 amidase [Knoellia subterranea KCTC 19937]